MIESAPLRWTGIEIVTNDFDSVQRLREATGLAPGTLLFIKDSRLQQACDAVRRELPGASVHCSPVIGAKVDGYAEGLYIVEINVGERPPLTSPACSARKLAPDLAALEDQWMETMLGTMVGGDSNTEHVNGERFLDYDSKVRHQLAERIHALVAPRLRELELASDSCTPESRSDAVYLMNFTGTPERAIRAASMRMNDPDEGVRNAATRLLFSFSSFITKGEVANVVKNACAATLLSGGFIGFLQSVACWCWNRSCCTADSSVSGLLMSSILASSRFAVLRARARPGRTGEPARRLVESAGQGSFMSARLCAAALLAALVRACNAGIRSRGV